MSNIKHLPHIKTMKTTNMLRSMILSFVVFNSSRSEAFVVSSPAATQQRAVGTSNNSPHHLMMDAAMELADSAASSASSSFVADSGLLLGGAFLQQSKADAAFSSITTAMAAAKHFCTPDIEAEVLTDINHVIMDFSAFLRPSKSLMKMGSVVGRLLVLLADYIPDHSIHSEELFVQLALLGLGVKDLLGDPSFASFDCGSQGNSTDFAIRNVISAFNDRMMVKTDSEY